MRQLSDLAEQASHLKDYLEEALYLLKGRAGSVGGKAERLIAAQIKAKP